MVSGSTLPTNAKKVQVDIKDTSLVWVGAIDFNLLDPGDLSDEITRYFEANLDAGDGINTVFHLLPLSDSAPLGGTLPVEIKVRLLDDTNLVIAEGTAYVDILASNKCYNFLLNPNAAEQAITIDVDESIEEIVDVPLG